MTTLNLSDLWIVGAYLALTLAFGFWLRRRASQSLEHYYLGGRRLPWQLLGLSGMTNWFDLTGTMVIVSFLYMVGPRGLFIEFRGGAVLVLAFMLAWTGKWYRRSGCMTGPEWCEFRFGTNRGSAALRAIGALFGVVFTVGMLAYLVRGTSLFLGFFFPGHGTLATLIILAISALYTLLAGFYGVVVNDLIQGVVIIIACVLVAVLAFGAVPDLATLAALAEKVTGNAAWVASAPSLNVTMPPGYEMYDALLVFTGFYLLRSVVDGVGAGDDSRYFAARSEADCGRLSALQMVALAFRWPMMIGFAVLGLILTADLLPDRTAVSSAATSIKESMPALTAPDWHEFTNAVAAHPESSPELAGRLAVILGPRWQQSLPLIGWNGSVNPEQILPAVLKHRLPAGARGFVLVAMLAALMSTLAGQVNSVGAAMFVRDIYQKFARPAAGDRELIVASYITTLAIVAIGFSMGLATDNINHLWGWLMMGFAAGALAPRFLRLYWDRCTAWGCAIGIAAGGIAAVLQRALRPDLVEWRQFVLTFGAGLAGVVIGSLLTEPPDRTAVQKFYRITRPFGFWRSFRAELSDTEQAAMRIEHRRDLCTMPCALLTQVTLFLIPMQCIIHAYGSLIWTLPLSVFGVIGMYFFWGRHLAATTKLVQTSG